MGRKKVALFSYLETCPLDDFDPRDKDKDMVFILEVHELIHGQHLLENYWSSKVGLSESITSKMHSSVFRGAVRHGLALNRFTQMAY